MQPSSRTEFQLAGPRSRSIRLHWCDQKCHLRLRLKLFESTVTPCGSLRVILLDDVGGYRETPANQQEENVEADCRCETPPKRDLGGICAKIDLAQRGACCKIQGGGLVRSPTKTQAADDAKSADHAVASMAG